MSGRKLDYQNFDLVKMKINKDGVDMEYFEKGGQNDKYVVNCLGQAHPDLTSALDELKEIAAKRLCLVTGWDYAREELRVDLDKLKGAKDGYDLEVERFKPSGIVFVGKDGLRGVKITGSLKCGTASVGMAIPNITFASEKLGYEQEVEEICERIKKETWCYHFKNKRAQQDLLDQAEQADEQIGELIDVSNE